MSRPLDLQGKTFTWLKVVKRVEDYINKNGTHNSMWLCQCRCGNEVIVRGVQLTSGKTKSCGCLRIEKARQSKEKFNKYDVSGEYGIGWTINTNVEFYFDLEDYDKIKNFAWYEDSHGYIYRTTNQKPQHHYMHKELVPFEIVDHENRNRKDNRKSNLREATFSKNNQNSSISTRNTSGIIGVHFNVKRQKWIAEIGINKQVKYLGGFENKEEAIKTRLQAELEHFGEEFAPQRHLFEKYQIKKENKNNEKD